MNASVLYYVVGDEAITSPVILSDVAFGQLRAVAYSLFAGWDVPDFTALFDVIDYADPDALRVRSFIVADDNRLAQAVRFTRTSYGYMPSLTENPRTTVTAIAGTIDYAAFVTSSFLPF